MIIIIYINKNGMQLLVSNVSLFIYANRWVGWMPLVFATGTRGRFVTIAIVIPIVDFIWTLSTHVGWILKFGKIKIKNCLHMLFQGPLSCSHPNRKTSGHHSLPCKWTFFACPRRLDFHFYLPDRTTHRRSSGRSSGLIAILLLYCPFCWSSWDARSIFAVHTSHKWQNAFNMKYNSD